MPFVAAYLLIAGGVCACAPLFKRMAKPLARLLSGAGFFVGLAVVFVAAYLALGLTFLDSILPPPASDLNAHPYLRYYLPLMLVLGVLLFSRPIRNIRWASLIGLAVGVLATYYVRVLLPTLSSTILIVVFLIATVVVYTLLRFVEDILEFIGTILAFPPIAVAIGLVSIYFGILIATSFP